MCAQEFLSALSRHIRPSRDSLHSEGADVLINISNDGYLGPTAVMRQHLANAVFRAVENDRPVLRVTNTGITAFITPSGEVRDATQAFQPEVRIWTITRTQAVRRRFTRRMAMCLLAVLCSILSLCSFIRMVDLEISARIRS